MQQAALIGKARHLTFGAGVCDPDHSNGLKCLKLAANGAIIQPLNRTTKGKTMGILLNQNEVANKTRDLRNVEQWIIWTEESIADFHKESEHVVARLRRMGAYETLEQRQAELSRLKTQRDELKASIKMLKVESVKEFHERIRWEQS